MPIKAECTSCGKRFSAPDAFAGKKVKCKGCGTIFRLPGGEPDGSSSSAGGNENELDALAQLEKTAAGDETETAAPSPGRVGPRLEKKLAANPFADEIPMSGPASNAGRANVLYFRYPGFHEVDSWGPVGLLILGLICMGLAATNQDTHGTGWIQLTRFATPVLLYLIIVYPITSALVRKASRELGYRLPPNPGLRILATYMPAMTLAICFWFGANGAAIGAVLGALLGVVISSAVLWLFLRLREEEIATSASYGAAGFAIGAAISALLIIGLNLLTIMMLTRSKSQASIPASPFGPGLSWIAQAPPVTVAVKKPPVEAVVPDNTAPPVNATESSFVSNVDSDKFPYPVSAMIRPLSGGAIVGLVHTGDNGTTIVEAWNTRTWQELQGAPLQLAGSLGQYAISGDGEAVAYLTQYPRLSVQTWTFATSRVSTFDFDQPDAKDVQSLDPKNVQLIGFTDASHVLIRINTGDGVAPNVELIKPAASEIDSEPARTFDVPPLWSTGVTMSVSTVANRLVVAGKVGTKPSLVQFDLQSGKELLTTEIRDIDPKDPVTPTGMSYSTDGSQIAVMFDDKSRGIILVYDSERGVKNQPFIFPAWPVSHNQFDNKTNAISWLGKMPFWLVYGHAIMNSKEGNVIGDLGLPNVLQQRVLDGDRIELVTGQSSSPHLAIVTLNKDKLSPTTAPAAP